MTDIKHTPAPWVATRREPSKNQWAVHPEVGGGTGWHDMADEENGYMSVVGIMREADARLIAAAPDLLAAMRRAEQFISNGIELGFIRMPDASTPDSAHDTLPAIRAALAKAGAQ